LKYRLSFIVALLVFTICIGCKFGSSKSIVKAGHPAPDFNLKNLSGSFQSKDSFAKKYILLNFWATWCAPCVEELPALNEFYKKFKDSDITVIGIAVDEDVEYVKEVVGNLNIEFPILIDDLGKIREAYKVRAFPETFLIDKDGKIKLFKDMKSGLLEIKIKGPREWSSSANIAYFKELLK